MTAFLVAARDDLRNLLAYHLEPLGFEVKKFTDALAAVNDIVAVTPDLVLLHSEDFPREWKPLLVLVRQRAVREDSVFILLTDEDFTFDEVAKASHLGVNGLLRSDLPEKELIQSIKDVFCRHKPLQDRRGFRRTVPSASDRFGFLFVHPRGAALVAGEVTDISLQGLAFKPNNAGLTADLHQGQQIKGCSLRLGENIITVECMLVRNREELGLRFEALKAQDHRLLRKYLRGRTQRRLEHMNTGGQSIAN